MDGRVWRSVWVLGLLLGVGVSSAQAEFRVAVVTDSRGFVHDVVAPPDSDQSLVVRRMRAVVEERLGGELLHVPDAGALALEGLDVVVFYSTGPIPLNVAALEAFVRAGGGVVGLHCATDTLKSDADWLGLLGGRFDGHPWNADDTVTLRNHDGRSAVSRPIGGSRTLKEEIYRFADFDASGSEVLVSLDMRQTPKKLPEFVPVTWLRNVGEGRVGYTSLGHRVDVWESDWYAEHVRALIVWSAGRGGAARPNPGLVERMRLLDVAAAEGVAASGRIERGRDPWVFRCTLDGRARAVVVALGPELWAAWDAAGCRMSKVWPGGMILTGSVYDTRHGPQPRTQGTSWWAMGSEPAWVWRSGGEMSEALPRWLGYRKEGQASVTFRYALGLADGAGGVEEVVVTETPELEGSTQLRRTLVVEGWPADAGDEAGADWALGLDVTNAQAEVGVAEVAGAGVWFSRDGESWERVEGVVDGEPARVWLDGPGTYTLLMAGGSMDDLPANDAFLETDR